VTEGTDAQAEVSVRLGPEAARDGQAATRIRWWPRQKPYLGALQQIFVMKRQRDMPEAAAS